MANNVSMQFLANNFIEQIYQDMKERKTINGVEFDYETNKYTIKNKINGIINIIKVSDYKSARYLIGELRRFFSLRDTMILFRGQENSHNYELKPNLYRNISDLDNADNTEGIKKILDKNKDLEYLLTKIVEVNHLLCRIFPKALSLISESLHILEPILQHYKLDTRYLDVTISFDVAYYFTQDQQNQTAYNYRGYIFVLGFENVQKYSTGVYYTEKEKIVNLTQATGSYSIRPQIQEAWAVTRLHSVNTFNTFNKNAKPNTLFGNTLDDLLHMYDFKDRIITVIEMSFNDNSSTPSPSKKNSIHMFPKKDGFYDYLVILKTVLELYHSDLKDKMDKVESNRYNKDFANKFLKYLSDIDNILQLKSSMITQEYIWNCIFYEINDKLININGNLVDEGRIGKSEFNYINDTFIDIVYTFKLKYNLVNKTLEYEELLSRSFNNRNRSAPQSIDAIHKCYLSFQNIIKSLINFDLLDIYLRTLLPRQQNNIYCTDRLVYVLFNLILEEQIEWKQFFSNVVLDLTSSLINR